MCVVSSIKFRENHNFEECGRNAMCSSVDEVVLYYVWQGESSLLNAGNVCDTFLDDKGGRVVLAVSLHVVHGAFLVSAGQRRLARHVHWLCCNNTRRERERIEEGEEEREEGPGTMRHTVVCYSESV